MNRDHRTSFVFRLPALPFCDGVFGYGTAGLGSVHVLLVAALTCAVVGCGQSASAPTKDKPGASPATTFAGDSKPESSSATPASADGAEAQAGTPIPGPTGRIEGTVTFVGDELPQPTIVTNGTDPQICGTEMSKLDVVISPETRRIKNVILWLDGVQLPDGYKPPTEQLVIDNTKCQFEPHVAVITRGSSVVATNSDEVLHTTHFEGVLVANPGLPGKGSRSEIYKARQSGLINVKCDKHGWMQAYIRVNPHPFHAVSDTDGKFAVAGVPVGTYKLKVWHEYLRTQEVEVAVNADGTTNLKITYPPAKQDQ